jgi:hypothetical protein
MTKNLIKTTLGLFLICSLSLNMSSCNFSRKEPITVTSDSESETTPSEADLEKGREEIMRQRAMRESLPSEENSTESSTSDNHQTQERMINWNCAWCCKIIQRSEEPGRGRCRGSYKNTTAAGKDHRENNNSPHSWYELGNVGNRKFECSHCQVVIDSEDEPRHGTCDGGDRLGWHSWREL